jgi:4-hydroxy-3-polyprenylbenzoate decarboxylase
MAFRVGKKDGMKQIIVAVTGASGAIYGVRLLEALNDAKVSVHLTVSPAAAINLKIETGMTARELSRFAKSVYATNDLAAPISSGSFPIDEMVIAPCSTKTMAAIANGYSDNLITRAAEVTLKERRTLVLVPRETPLNQIHLKNMLTLARAGAVILPACPGFYNAPKKIDELVDHVVGKIMDALQVEHSLYKRWTGFP